MLLLDSNRLSGTGVPATLEDLRGLTHLYLYNNLLSGTRPADLAGHAGRPTPFRLKFLTVANLTHLCCHVIEGVQAREYRQSLFISWDLCRVWGVGVYSLWFTVYGS